MANIVRMVRQGLVFGTTVVEEVYHWYVGASSWIAAVMEIAEGIDIAWEDNLRAHATSQQEWLGWGFTRVDLQEQPTFYIGYQGLTDGVGLGSTSPLPGQVTLPLNFYAATPYPRRARKLLGCFTETANTSGGLPSSTIQSAAETFASDILDIEEAGGEAAHMLAVRYTGSPPYVDAYNQVISRQVATRWGTLRSRRT